MQSKLNDDRNVSIMPNLQTNCCLKLDFQEVDRQTEGKWLIYDTKHCNNNHLLNVALPWIIS